MRNHHRDKKMPGASQPKYDRKTSGISTNRRVLLVRFAGKEIEESAKTETPLAALTASALSLSLMTPAPPAGSIRRRKRFQLGSG
jgi:hypothetical protein